MALKQISLAFDEEPVVNEPAPKVETEPKVVAVAIEKPAPDKIKAKGDNRKLTRGRVSLKEKESGADLIDIPEDGILFEKKYYSIGIVANMFKVNQSLIRFWENEFDILKPRKTRKGDRLFRPEDVKNIELIYHLLRQRKFSMEGAKQYLEANKQHAETNKILIQSLTKLRNFLSELKTNLGE